MFQTLTDQQEHASGKERAIRYSALSIIFVVLVLALYFGVRSAG